MKNRSIIPLCCAGAALLACTEARAELVAHWKFEGDDPFEESVSRLNLNPEGKNTTGKNTFRVTGTKPTQIKDSKGSLSSPNAKGIDLHLRVNAPTRGSNPFRLSANSWTLSGWFAHTGAKPSAYGHVIAGTHGYSSIPGRGQAGWCLKLIEGEGGKKVLTAIFSSGGEAPIMLAVKGSEPIETGAGKWNHFALVWQHDGGAAKKGEARLFTNGKPAGTAAAAANFDAATADRNAFRGIWIAGRPTSELSDGSDNWAGHLDEFKFDSEARTVEAVMAEFSPVKEVPVVAAVTPAPPKKPATGALVTPPKPEPAPAPPPKPAPPVETVLEMRTWTDARKQTMEAAMVKTENPDPGRVLLQTADKIRLSVSIENLSPEDQAYFKGK